MPRRNIDAFATGSFESARGAWRAPCERSQDVKLALEHPWDLTPSQARDLQRDLSARVETRDRLGPVRTVAGVDVGFRDAGRITHAAVAVLSCADLSPVATATASVDTTFPYVPGLLSFREIPAVLEAVSRLATMPDLFLCDGQGIAHPRRFGVACHLGVLLDRPAVGVAKSRLTGTHATVPEGRGEWTALRDGDEVLGAVLRTRRGVKPLFVSPGHRIGLATAVARVMACVTRYRLPETTRLADRLASGRP